MALFLVEMETHHVELLCMVLTEFLDSPIEQDEEEVERARWLRHELESLKEGVTSSLT